MAIQMSPDWAAGNITKKLVGKNAVLIEIVKTGDDTRIALSDSVIVPLDVITIAAEPPDIPEVAAFRINDYIAKVT